MPRHEMLAGRRVQVWFANDAKKEGEGAGAVATAAAVSSMGTW